MPNKPDCQEVDPLADDRGFVIRLAGAVSCCTPALIIILSFIDAATRKVAWEPDDKILTACLAAGAAIIAFAWRTRR